MAIKKRTTVKSLPMAKPDTRSNLEKMLDEFIKLGQVCEAYEKNYDKIKAIDPKFNIFNYGFAANGKAKPFTPRTQAELYNALLNEFTKENADLPQSVLDADASMTKYLAKVETEKARDKAILAYSKTEEYRQAKAQEDRVRAEKDEARRVNSERKRAALKRANQKNLEDIARAKIAQYDAALENARRTREEAEAESIKQPPIDAEQVRREREAIQELERRLKAPFHAAEDGTKENRTHRRW